MIKIIPVIKGIFNETELHIYIYMYICFIKLLYHYYDSVIIVIIIEMTIDFATINRGTWTKWRIVALNSCSRGDNLSRRGV